MGSSSKGSRDQQALKSEITDIDGAPREKAQGQLREQLAMYQLFLDRLPPLAMLLRPKTREIVACNKTGEDVGALPGKTCFATWGQSDKPCPWCLAPKLWSTGEPQHLVIEGVGRVWDAYWIPISDDLYLHYAFDITEQKRVEEDRERLIAELEAKNAELEQFTYAVSHDLKSPLITVNGYLSLLQEDLAAGDTAAVEQDVARVVKAADKMGQLLGELLELSRVGRVLSPPEDVDLGQLAREAVELLGGQINRRKVRLEIAPDLPTVRGDRTRLFQVVQNLLDNAVKYMGDQPEPRIEIGVRLYGDEKICYICDNGMGIEPHHQERIFGLFDQLDRRTEGSGVGLALVKRIVEVHGGRLWVESGGSGQGSTFCFTIPPRDETALQSCPPEKGPVNERQADDDSAR